jgi:hypothetical protein
MTTVVFEILEIKLNKMIFHAYKSTLSVNVGQTDRTVSSMYNDIERILNGTFTSELCHPCCVV